MDNSYGMYALYDTMISSGEIADPCVLGGKVRSRTAVRDEHGRFMPMNEEAFETWQLDPEHGKHGGIVRAQIAKRDARGRFAS